MLEFRDVSRSFAGPEGPVDALREISFAAAPGDVVAVWGASGCGKTTLLLTAGTLLRPTAGTVLLDGEDPYALSQNGRSAVRSGQVGFVFQQFHLVPYLTVLENILVPAVACPDAAAGTRAEGLLARFGLESRRHHVPAQLSTGERQRTALARALLNSPKVILADEPTGNLDEENGQAVLDYLAEFAGAGGLVLVATHDARVAEFASRRLVLDSGRLVGAGG